ncbi:MAG: chemotaxis protein [Myxococcales bacterium]|nr:chemotaxis protein [Myxococcales bacterium]
MNTPTPDQVISDAEFVRFRDYFYQKTGIHFAESKRYFVDKRIVSRMEATGHKTFRTWFTFMRFDMSGEELSRLTELMTVNETYFFRESYQFDCLVNSALTELHEARPRGRTLRILSLPCSTGEEPYSIALYLLEYWPHIHARDVEIHGADIDGKVLAKAQEGIYSKSSIRLLPPELLETYFRPRPAGGMQVVEDVRACVSFAKVNVINRQDMGRYRGFDVIFCRNLLIYFDDVMRRQAAAALYDALNPGGFVFLGHSESMSRISSMYTPRRFPDALVYQKSTASGGRHANPDC